MITAGLGTDTGGYDYNALVQSQTLAWLAQPSNKMLLMGGGLVLVLLVSLSGKRSRR